MNQTRVMALTVIIFSCWAAYGCAAAPAAPQESKDEPLKVKILDYKCKNGAVSAIALSVDSAGTAVFGWDNEKACGTPA